MNSKTGAFHKNSPTIEYLSCVQCQRLKIKKIIFTGRVLSFELFIAQWCLIGFSGSYTKGRNRRKNVECTETDDMNDII